MSRCFPYPPPGYSLSRAGNEALIESIKLQKEREKSKEEKKRRKEKKEKNEKKEKRKEKKEKRKEKREQNTNQYSGTHILDKACAEEKVWVGPRDGFPQNGRKAETEQLEKSSLTEERGQPVCSRIPSSSSDSTENSNKRKRNAMSIDGSSSLGNIIKIRFSSKKNKPDTPVNKPQVCSTSGRMDFLAQQKGEIAPGTSKGTVGPTSLVAGNLVRGFSSRTNQEQRFTTSMQIEAAQSKPGTSSAVNGVLTPIQRLELQYNNLVENWVPLELCNLTNDDDGDQEWLFKSKNKDVRAEKRFRSSCDGMSCSSSSALWPRSQYLHDADIHALPYAVPF